MPCSKQKNRLQLAKTMADLRSVPSALVVVDLAFRCLYIPWIVFIFDWSLISRMLWMNVWSKPRACPNEMRKSYAYSELWSRTSLVSLQKFVVSPLNRVTMLMEWRVKKMIHQSNLDSLLDSLSPSFFEDPGPPSETAVASSHSWVSFPWVPMCFLKQGILSIWRDSGLPH